MTTQHAADIESIIKAEIAAQLGFDPKHPPSQVSDKQAAEVLGAKTTTLAVWRSTVTVRRTHLPASSR